VDRLNVSPLRDCDSTEFRGASIDELIHYGAWAGAKYLPLALDSCLRSSISIPGLLPDGLLSLMMTATREGALIRTGAALPVEPDAVYSRLVPLLAHNRVEVRKAAFFLVSCVAKDDLHRVVEASLPADGFGDEMHENMAMKELIPEVIRNSLIWPHDAPSGEHEDQDAWKTTHGVHQELGYFISWLLFLDIAGDGSDGGSSSSEDRSFRRIAASYLRSNEDIFTQFFVRSMDVVIGGNAVERTAASTGAMACLEYERSVMEWMSDVEVAGAQSLDVLVGSYAGGAFAFALQRLPAMSRQHVAERIDRGPAIAVEDFVRRKVSPLLIADEIRKVREWSASGSGEGREGGHGEEGELNARGSVAGREVWASYTLSDVTLEVALRLPETFPLQAVEVVEDSADGKCSRHVGMSKGAWRKTVIGMNTLLRFKDGSVAEAVEVWRRNLDKTFQGVEECPICYSVLHLATAALPKMQCRTCKNLFHSQCLCRWFTKSSSSACPMCRSAF
jgi:Ring finger domain